MSRLWFWLLTLCVLLAPADAWAKIRRYAVVVGNDLGAGPELPLRFAQADARKVAEVLVSLGGVPRENLVLLTNAEAGEVERALIAINDRLRVERGAGDDTMLVVYYSGHADAQTLHLGTTELELDRLRRLVRGSSAEFRLLILDACRSGAITRAKGAKRVAPFELQVEEQLEGEGVVFMTASAADEDAQESDELRGSFFTHYLLSGLRGAADSNRDGTVSLAEAYDHAYSHTLRATSRSFHGAQHPFFEFDLRGQGHVTLTRLESRGGGVLEFPKNRTYLVFADDEAGPVIGEVSAADQRRRLVLPAGGYFVRGRAPDHLLEGHVRVANGETVRLDDDRMERIDYARLVRKGAPAHRVTHGPLVAYQLRSPLWDESSLCHGLRVGYPIDLKWLTLAPRVGFCRAKFDSPDIETRADEYDLELQITHVFDVPIVSIGVGVGGGVSWLRQTFETTRSAPPRNTVGGHADALLDLWWDLPQGFYVLTQGAFALYAFEQQLEPREPSVIRAVPTGRLVAGVGKRF